VFGPIPFHSFLPVKALSFPTSEHSTAISKPLFTTIIPNFSEPPTPSALSAPKSRLYPKK
jgi:hypothetical protein